MLAGTSVSVCPSSLPDAELLSEVDEMCFFISPYISTEEKHFVICCQSYKLQYFFKVLFNFL